jgi:3-oxoacyl-[acyl-carrier protein] reductase
MRDLAGKSCILTGASRGIGRTLALRLAAEGVLVTAIARDHEALGTLRDENPGIYPHTCDVTDENGVKKAVSLHLQQHESIDILVNNAGTGTFGPIEEVPYREFLRTMEINAGGTYLFMQAALPHMKKAGDGDIINIASVVGLKGYPDQAAYGASKHAVMGLTRSIATEAAPSGVRVRAVCPGGVDTDLLRRARPDLDPATLIRTDDVAEAVLFMLKMSDSGITDFLPIRRKGSEPQL